jgi:hypothetical protein
MKLVAVTRQYKFVPGMMVNGKEDQAHAK